MKILDVLRARDPDLLNLRKAARAALVSGPLFALLNGVLGLSALSSFAFFACFVGLVFADFGGPLRSRVGAYAAMTVIGAVLVIIASLLSDNLLASAAVMFVVMFSASFSSVFGGYAPAFVAPIALAYSLAVLEPLSAIAISDRLLGWVIGGVAALVAAVTLWPLNQRLRLRETLAKVASGLAATLTSLHDRDVAEAHFRDAGEALAEARRKASTPLRPAGPTSRQIGLLHLVANLEQALDATRKVLDSGWAQSHDEELAAACANAFRLTGAILTEQTSPDAVAAGIKQLDDVRLPHQHLAEIIASADKTQDFDGQASTPDVLEAIRRSAPLMALSHIAIWVEIDAAMALGGNADMVRAQSTPELSPATDRPAEIIRRAQHILSGSLDPDGVIFRNSIRAASAMTFAVVMAQVVPVAHGFWVTLGALLVLRSSASSTSATALKAIAGTIVGFAIAAVVLLLFGDQDAVLWGLLPIAIFFAGYTPGAVSFVVGQVSFTTLVVILFTLIDDVGLSTDFARLETVSLGAASAAAIAFILWPRGARAALARAVANLYRAASDATRILVTGAEDVRQMEESRLRSAHRRADEAFGVALNERGRTIDTHLWLALARAPNLVTSLAHGLLGKPSPGIHDLCNAAIEAVDVHRDAVAGELGEVAAALEPAPNETRHPATKEPGDMQAKLMHCFDLSRSHGPASVEDALLLIGWSEQLTNVSNYIKQVEPDIERVAEVSRPHAWLRWSAPTQ